MRVNDEYDVEYPKPIGIPGARLRLDHSRDRGEVTAFVAQLEYQLTDNGAAGEWVEFVRSDHDSTSEGGHDVTREGTHLDVYCGGEKVDSEPLTGPLPADDAFDAAEERITDDAERYVRRLQRWHRNNHGRSGRPNGPSE